MKLVDSHCHLNMLDLSAHEGDLNHALDAARQNQIKHFLTVCTVLEDFPVLLNYAETYVDVSCSVGVHPDEQETEEPTVERLVTLATHPKVIAIGETGLDYYRLTGDLTWQRDRFRHHIAAAKQVKKPLIIHTRNAREDTIQLMREEHAQEVGGVMHCFTEDWDMAKKSMDLNFYISFSGIVTFKNAKELQEIAKKIPADRFLIETDSPYLAPIPHRGKRNEPAWVLHVAQYLADLRGVSVETIAEQSTENFSRLFRVRV